MASEDVQTNLRLPVELKDRLVSSAIANNRSLSAETSLRLAQSYDDASPEMARLISDLQTQLEAMQRSEIAYLGLLRRAGAMFGLLLGRLRELGASLRPDETQDLSVLLDEMQAELTRSEALEILIKRAEVVRSQLVAIDREIELHGMAVSEDEKTSIERLDERIQQLKHLHLKTKQKERKRGAA